jgi:hypothetical protein
LLGGVNSGLLGWLGGVDSGLLGGGDSGLLGLLGGVDSGLLGGGDSGLLGLLGGVDSGFIGLDKVLSDDSITLRPRDKGCLFWGVAILLLS